MLGSSCESVDEMDDVSVGVTVTLSGDIRVPVDDDEWLDLTTSETKFTVTGEEGSWSCSAGDGEREI